MNVLVIVFTMLMLLSIMTYARLQSFLTFSGVRSAYESYMQESERKYSNETQRKLYANARVKKVKAHEADSVDEDLDQDEEESYSPGRASAPKSIRKLNLQPLLKGGPDNPLTLPTAQLLSRLINQMYFKQKFYQAALIKDPDFVNRIVATIAALKGKNVGNAPVDSLGDLAKVSFSSTVARGAFGQMLEGAPTVPPLGDQVTICAYATPIRMMGASDELLLSIYRDPNVVESLKNRRLELYQAVKSGHMKPAEAATALSDQFGGDHASEFSPFLLDFTISSTRPEG